MCVWDCDQGLWLGVTTPTDVVNQRAHVFERPRGSNGCFPGMRMQLFTDLVCCDSRCS